MLFSFLLICKYWTSPIKTIHQRRDHLVNSKVNMSFLTNGTRSRSKHSFRPLPLSLFAAKLCVVLDLVLQGQGPGILRPTLSLLSVQEIFLIIAGIEVNPRPYTPKFSCMFCGKAARWKQRCLHCNLCSTWYHENCLGMWMALYKEHEEHPSL